MSNKVKKMILKVTPDFVYQKYRNLKYNKFVDIYKGKGYKVVKYKGVYRLLPREERIISSTLIALENAASDVEGKLLVQK